MNDETLTNKNVIISVIIALYNNKSLVEKAIQSVINQKNSGVELIVIDGNSIDGSQEIVEIYKSEVSYYISEPDKGIYDAMNKGVEQAKGKWIYFLGSDDTLQPEVLSQVMPYLADTYAMVYGDIVFDSGRRVPSFLSPRILLQNTIHHQGAFYNKSLFVNFRYNTQLRVLSDYELNLKIYRQNLPTQRLPMVIALCREGGASSDLLISLGETNSVRASSIGNGVINKAFSLLLYLYYAQKKIRKILFK